MRKIILISILFFTITAAQQQEYYLYEDFDTLESWRPLTFPKIEAHTRYSIIQKNDSAYLKAESKASASGIIYTKTFNVKEYPIVEWKWKITNIYKNGNARIKDGDDYPIRIYIVFKYDPDAASFFKKAQYETARLLYGEYPPHSSLNYIWASRDYSQTIIPNAYTAKAQMFILEKGAENINKWITEKVNILEDYEKAFKQNPPNEASIAIMSDSDNTKESATAFVDYIIIRAK